jgi:hypothetical protein
MESRGKRAAIPSIGVNRNGFIHSYRSIMACAFRDQRPIPAWNGSPF